MSSDMNGRVITDGLFRQTVVFWDSEAPGYEGDRILFSESLTLNTPDQVHGPGWRSDRRCRFPVEIGLHLQRPCRLQQVVVVSELGLAPSAVECFVAGPTRARLGTEGGGRKRASRAPPRADSWRHNGSREASTETSRAGYLSSIFVRIGSADFSERVETAPRGRDTRSLPPRTVQAVLPGLSFKGQFLRLVLWEAEGGRDNLGRQVSVTHVQVLGSTLGDERPGRKVATAAASAVAERKTSRHGDVSENAERGPGTILLDKDGNGSDREENAAVEQVLAGLGIAPNLISGQGQRRQACAQGRDGRGAGGRGVHRGGRDEQDTWCGLVKEATSRLCGMLQIAHAEERFNEAELLTVALDRARSLGGSIRSARRAQHKASRRENFDEAKRWRDRAMEAEIWLRQTVRDASEAFQGGVRGAADASSQLPSFSSAIGCTAPVGQESIDEKAAARSSSETNTHDVKSKASPEEKVETTAPFHDEGGESHYAQENKQGDVDKDYVTEGEGGDSNDKHDVSPPWLDPTCPRSTEPWKGVLLTLPWPRGVLPDFRTVFSHRGDGLTFCSAAAFESDSAGNRRRGRGDGGGLSTRSSSQQPGGLLRTVLRLVAASQDLRPPGPVPPDIAPFRRAGSADGRPPLCTFFFSMSRPLCPKMSLDEMLADIHDTPRMSNHGERGGEQDKRFGRAFAQPAADATPSATALTNWIEDNPKLAWGKPLVLCFPFITSQQGHSDTSRRHSMQPSYDGFGAAGGSKTPAAAKEKDDDIFGGMESASGKKSRNSAVDGDADVSYGVNYRGGLSDKDSGHEKSSGQSGRDPGMQGSSGDGISHEDMGGAGPVPAGKAAPGVREDEPLEEVSDGLARTAASFLPDVVGAGGFSEFVPLLDAMIGRVPLSAACAGFPASMRASAISVCQAHLHQTADIAIKAYNAAASPANTDNSASGAVFRAACLVATQGLMDPADGPRLAAESLAMSAVSLWGFMPEAAGERRGPVGDRSEEQVEQENNFRAPASAGFFRPMAGTALPLRDLRWGVELVLASVAPYLADGLPEVAGNDPEADEQPPKASNGGNKRLIEGVDDSVLRRSSYVFSGNDSSKTESAPPEERVTPNADNPASGGTMAGQAGGSGGAPSPDEDTARINGSAAQELAEDGWQRSEPSFDANGVGYQSLDSRSRLALRVVSFACRHPDVGTALVSSILVTWIPFFLRWGRTAPSRAHTRSTSGAMAAQSGSAVSGARAGSPASRGAPAGEAEAAEALAAGAIHMLAFMVRTFPLLPLSDFSAETLAGAAEGGMAFEGGHSSPSNGSRAGVNMTKHRRSGRAGRDRNPTAGGAGGGLDRRSHPSSTSGRAQHAGETLMLELFLHASTTGGGGGGGLKFLDELLPALSTARGMNCAHATSSALFAERKGRRKGQEETTSQEEGKGSERGHGEGRLEYPRVTRNAVKGGAVRDYGVALSSVDNTVEVRRRLPVPILRQPSMKAADVTTSLSSLGESVAMTPPILDDEDGSDDDGEGHHSAVPPMSDGQDGGDGVGLDPMVPPTLGDDDDDDVDGDGHHLSSGNTTNVGEDPHMSDSSSVSLRLSSDSSSSETIGSAQPTKEVAVVTPAVRGDERPQALIGESKKASKVFPLSSLGNGGVDQKEVDGPDTESNPGATHVVLVATSDVAGGSGSVGEQPLESSPGGQKDKKSHGGGFISRLFRRGKA